MKIIIGILLAFIFTLPGKSQKVNKYEFIGTITINKGKALSYKIVFNKTNSNNISGYSITDLSGENLTRTSITGKYDTINNILSFKELSNIYTKVDGADSNFCYIAADKLKIKTYNGNKLITGNFKGLFPSGEICANGKIMLTETAIIKKIKSMVDSVTTSTNSKVQVQEPIKVFNNQQELVMMSREKLFVEYLGNELTLEIWDGAIIDDDKISIYLNDTLLKQDITLTGKRRCINLPATENSFKLKVVALNIGRAGVNTVQFVVKDSTDVKNFSSRLNKGESFEVEFKGQ